MLILHAGIDNGHFMVWGETPAEVPAGQPGRTSTPTDSPPYPFDAGPMRLAVALIEALPGKPIPSLQGDPPVIWLPTCKGRPIPSSGLIADIPVSGSVSIQPWQIAAIPLPFSHMIDLLCLCMDRDTLGQGLLIGSTLAYWSRVLRFAGSLLAREQIVPGLKAIKGGYRAVWQHVIAGPDGERLARFVRSMPHATRAISRLGQPQPDRSPTELVHEFLSRATDTLVRLAVHGPAGRTKGGRVHVQQFTTIHDRWLFGLNLSVDGGLDGEEKELAQLAAQVRDWQRPIAVSSQSPFGLVFRLEEPGPEASEKAPWRVRYLLQARDDPSLFIPVAEAWKEESRFAKQFAQRGFQPREYLLTALGQAAAFSQSIERSLKSASPAGFLTDAEGAYQFLSQTAWMLEQAGFIVMLPSWWTKKGGKQRLNVLANVHSPKMLSVGGNLSLDQLVNFEWQIALGEQTISLQELQELAKLKAPLVKVRGQWVQVGAAEIKAAIELLQHQPEGKGSLRQVVQMALGSGEAPGGLPFGGVKATGWVAEFLAQLEGKTSFEELPPPEGFRGTLRPYQLIGYSWLHFLRQWGLGACLADDMGLGKTIQTLALIQREWPQRQRPSLLICPTSVVANWKKEAERFTPNLPVLIHHGGKRTRSEAFSKQIQKYALVLSSYSLLYRDCELFAAVPWAGVILDEAQNIKNPRTKQAMAARSLKAEYRIALTGTPVENHVGDLWSILEFLNPGWLGSQNDFRQRFFIPIQAQQDADAALHLKRLTAPFILRRLKTDKSIINDLPEKLEMKVFCTLTREQGTLYQSIVDELSEQLDSTEGIQRKGLVLATLIKLKQVCNHPAQFLKDGSPLEGRSGKLARLTEMLEEILESGDRSLIFTQFTEMGELLKSHLQSTFGKEVLFLHGAIGREARVRMVERFQHEEEGPRIFLLSLKAGGTGLNLTRAQHVFHFDRWWNPAVENQATDRAFRIGQRRNVQVHKFVCVGTVEEKIDEMIESKQSVAARVVGTKEDWLTEMSNDQLRDLFKLRKEAIEE